jgi:hypothetical protein
MKVVSIEAFRTQVDHFLAATVNGDVILTRDGKPSILLRAIPEYGDEDEGTFAGSAEFWQMIRQRCQEQGIPWEEAKKELDLG